MHMHMYVFICIYIIYVCIYKIKKMNKEKRKISYNTFHIFVHKKFFFCFLVDDRILRYFFFCSVLFVNLFHLIVIICSCSAFKISYFDSNLGMWECQQIVINMSWKIWLQKVNWVKKIFHMVVICRIGAKGWCMENSWWNWLFTKILSRMLSHFSVENGKLHKMGTGLVSWLCTPLPWFLGRKAWHNVFDLRYEWDTRRFCLVVLSAEVN